ncbi:hypothetical protein Tco_1497083, partial [Tanacetum coccineum]
CYGGGGVDGGVRGEDDGDEEGGQRKGGKGDYGGVRMMRRAVWVCVGGWPESRRS